MPAFFLAAPAAAAAGAGAARTLALNGCWHYHCCWRQRCCIRCEAKKFTFREVREARKEKQKLTMHVQDAKKILLLAVAMNNGIFALARIKIAPYGNLVGNCRDMMPHDWRQDKAREGEGEGKKKELQPKVNQVTLFLPTAFRQCAKIAVKQKLRPVTQSHSSLSTSALTAGPRHGTQKKKRSWMAASRQRRLRGLGSQLETACLPSGMQLDALDCFFCCSHSMAYTPLPLTSPPPPPPTPRLGLRPVVRLCIGAGTTIQRSFSRLLCSVQASCGVPR